MAQLPDREELLALLRQLGDADDAAALAAARALHAQISDAELEWDELLTAEPLASASAATARANADAPAGARKGGRDGDTLALIEQLLAMPDRSEALREELEEYKADIATGEFATRDHQYVRALHKRLLG